ncbi:MAG: peptide chain release factor N(5)-glutamine methyltransferase [Planctomycetota bacterium]
MKRTDVWTTRALLRWTAEHLERKGVDQPRLSAEMLLAHVLGVERLKLYTDADRPASELERAAFRELVERAAEHEPVDYLVGKSPFFSLMLEVTPATLIPRPSTETLVEHVIQHARRTPGFANPLIADIGTGSGAIAIALAKHIEGSRVVATDLSAPALDIARRNAEANGVADRIDLRQGDLLEPLGAQRVDYLVSNPPYIPDAEWDDVDRNVKEYEPESALRGGADGLQYVRPLIEAAGATLNPPGHVAIEIAAATKAECIAIAEASPALEHVRVLADHEALPRVLVADRVVST